MSLTALLLLASLADPSEAELRFRFIGNAAFEISDGAATLLIDFPYESGAFGYMTFDPAELHTREPSLCLFTHRHRDHFDPAALAKVGCSVAGPREVVSRAGNNAIAAEGPPWNFGGASIRCLPTQHANVEHCSYLVQWHDKRLFFAGDLENLEVLSQEQEPLDAIFLPAWLASDSTRIRAKFPAARIVIDHHRTGEEVAECDGCLIPAQGARFTLPGAPIPAGMP